MTCFNSGGCAELKVVTGWEEIVRSLFVVPVPTLIDSRGLGQEALPPGVFTSPCFTFSCFSYFWPPADLTVHVIYVVCIITVAWFLFVGREEEV